MSAVPQLPLYANSVGNGRHLVLFIHGWSCRRSDWDDTFSYLVENPEFTDSFRFMAVDLPGHGDARDMPWTDWSVAALGQWVAEVAVSQHARFVSLVGHSLGGCVALEAARRISNLNEIVLVDTFGIPYGDLEEQAIATLEEPFREDFVSAMRVLVQRSTGSYIDPDKVDWIKDRMASGDPEKMLPLWSNALRWSPDTAFTEIVVPMVAINGENVPKVARERCAPFVTSKIIPGASHFPQFERPKLFNAALAKTLKEF